MSSPPPCVVTGANREPSQGRSRSSVGPVGAMSVRSLRTLRRGTLMEDATVMSATHAHGPLTGIRVIDLSAVVSGPFGTAILADQGADVITVEQARGADMIRSAGPVADSAQGVSAYWSAMNRNKRAIALDLKQPAGKQLVFDLVATADVLVQNFRPGALDRLGLGWEVLSALNPQLIMCSISGFGPDGPYAHRPAFDPIVQSVASYPVVQTDDAGRPQLVNTIVCDKVTSLNVAQSVCAALVARASGAGGQHIELAMVDASIHFLWPEAMWNLTYLDHPSDVPDLSSIYKLYRTKDGWAMVYPVATTAHWEGLCHALGRPDLAADPRFADIQGRLRNGHVVNDELAVEIKRFSTAEFVELMDAADVPVAPVNTREAMIEDPHVRHRGIVVETEHPTAGRIRQARPPAIFSKTPSGLRRAAPCFGEHTDEVLAEVLGLSATQISDLRSSGAVC
ncbi:MAG: CoA transferase [Acidimicrobiia bacterium]|nr:CoA transferase [Acidimicrobiia bacterium]